MGGYRELHVGQAVVLDFEVASQDRYAYRAIEVWPSGETPVARDAAGPFSAYRSSLTLDEN